MNKVFGITPTPPAMLHSEEVVNMRNEVLLAAAIMGGQPVSAKCFETPECFAVVTLASTPKGEIWSIDAFIFKPHERIKAKKLWLRSIKNLEDLMSKIAVKLPEGKS